MIDKLYKICEALGTRFPDTSDPFRILARLMEESAELADQVGLVSHARCSIMTHWSALRVSSRDRTDRICVRSR